MARLVKKVSKSKAPAKTVGNTPAGKKAVTVAPKKAAPKKANKKEPEIWDANTFLADLGLYDKAKALLSQRHKDGASSQKRRSEVFGGKVIQVGVSPRKGGFGRLDCKAIANSFGLDTCADFLFANAGKLSAGSTVFASGQTLIESKIGKKRICVYTVEDHMVLARACAEASYLEGAPKTALRNKARDAVADKLACDEAREIGAKWVKDNGRAPAPGECSGGLFQYVVKL